MIVVGCGNSGSEIAVDLWEYHAKPTIIIRDPIHIGPRSMFRFFCYIFDFHKWYYPNKLLDFGGRIVCNWLYSDLSKHFGIQLRQYPGWATLMQTTGKL